MFLSRHCGGSSSPALEGYTVRRLLSSGSWGLPTKGLSRGTLGLQEVPTKEGAPPHPVLLLQLLADVRYEEFFCLFLLRTPRALNS